MSFNQSMSDKKETQYRKTGRSKSSNQQHRGFSFAFPTGASAGGPDPSISSNRSFKKLNNKAQGGQSSANVTNLNPSDAGASETTVTFTPPKQTEPSVPQRSSEAAPKAPASQSSFWAEEQAKQRQFATSHPTSYYPDGSSSAARTHPSVSQSQPMPSFVTSHPTSYYTNSYNPNPLFFSSPNSHPLTSSHMPPNSQAPRFSYPVSQGPPQSIPFMNPRGSTMLSVLSPQMSNGMGNNEVASSKPSRSDQLSAPSQCTEFSGTTSNHEGESVGNTGGGGGNIENIGSGGDSLTVSGSKDKPLPELSRTKSTTAKGKNKRKEILSKAAAAMVKSDLYGAYKNPEDKNDIASSESVESTSTTIMSKQEAADSTQQVAVVRDEGTPSKAEPDDCEDAADISTPKVGTSDNGEQSCGDKDGSGHGAKKYSRDFLLKFSMQLLDLPEGSEITSDIAKFLNVNVNASPSVDYIPELSRTKSTASKGKKKRKEILSKDVQVSPTPPASQTQKPSGPPITGISMPMQFHQPQVSVQFGGPNQQILSQGMTANSLQMPMPIQLPIGSTQVQQPVFVPGLQAHPMQPPGIMHQAQNRRFTPQMGPQLPQLGNLGINIAAQYPQQQGGKFAGPRKTPVKITHPDTHEQLRLDKRADSYPDGGSSAARTHPSVSQSQPMLSFAASHPTSYYTNPYNPQPLFFPSPNSHPLTSNHMPPNSQSPRFSYPMSQGPPQSIPFMNPRGSTMLSVLSPQMSNGMGNNEVASSKSSRSDQLSAPSQCTEFSGTTSNHEGESVGNTGGGGGNIENIGSGGDSLTVSGSKDKPLPELSRTKSTTAKGKKKRKEILSKAAAAMVKSDLYGAYKNPEDKNDIASSESVESTSTTIMSKQEAADSTQLVAIVRDEDAPSKAEPDDWEDVADSSTPKLGTSDSGEQACGDKDGSGHGAKKYSRDFLLKFSMQFLDLPEGFEIMSDIAELLKANVNASPSVDYKPLPELSRTKSTASKGKKKRKEILSKSAAAMVKSDMSSASELNVNFGRRDPRSTDRTPPHARALGAALTQNVPSEKSEKHLRDLSLGAIKEFYSARDEKEVAICIKDLNSPRFHPSMISLWVTDSFERKDAERDLLAKLLVNLTKSQDGTLSQSQLIKGFETVLSTLEDAMNDAPRAPEFLALIFARVILENVVSLNQFGQLIHEGGEEPGHLLEVGLAGNVLGNILENIKSEKGEIVLNEILTSSNLRLETFRPPFPRKSRMLEKFI